MWEGRIIAGIFLSIAIATIYYEVVPPKYDYFEYYMFRDYIPNGKNRTVTVFGATGGIGKLVVRNALAYGFNVTAYVRNISKVERRHPRLRIVTGTLNDMDKIKDAMFNSSAVISCIGPEFSKVPLPESVSDGHKNIILAAEQSNISRFITLSSPAYEFKGDKLNLYTSVYKMYMDRFYPYTNQEHIKMAEDAQKSSLNYTVVRFYKPTDDVTLSRLLITHGENLTHPYVSRDDISQFMLTNLEHDLFIHDMPILGH